MTKIKKRLLKGLVVVSIVAAIFIVYGMINARTLYQTNYQIKINKHYDDDKLNIVLASDLHLGRSIGLKEINKMVKKINSNNPDIVLIAGDIFDNNYDSISNPMKIAKALRAIKSKYGTYATFGNHDINEKLAFGFTINTKSKKSADPRMYDFVKKSNIILMEDEVRLIDNKFYLIGRTDFLKPGAHVKIRKSVKQLTNGLDKTKPIIVMEHEPRDLGKMSKCGVDLDLNGHTHAGQIWPLTWIINLFWDNAYGYLNINGTHDIVTSGVGIYGPYMRVGCKSEIVNIKATFNNK